jgi:hypothetical protein
LVAVELVVALTLLPGGTLVALTVDDSAEVVVVFVVVVGDCWSGFDKSGFFFEFFGARLPFFASFVSGEIIPPAAAAANAASAASLALPLPRPVLVGVVAVEETLVEAEAGVVVPPLPSGVFKIGELATGLAGEIVDDGSIPYE